MIGAGEITRDVQTRNIRGMPFICLPTERVMIKGEEVEVRAYCMNKTEVTVNDYYRIMPDESQPVTEYVLITRECGKSEEVQDRQLSLGKLKKEPAVDGEKICMAKIEKETFKPDTDDRVTLLRDFAGPKQPMVNMNWSHAQRFCERIGGRLPSTNEWYRAALGPGKGYGNIPEYPTNDGTLKCGDNAQCDAAGTKDVGSFPDGPFGFKDLAGNVAEWTEGKLFSHGGSWKNGSFSLLGGNPLALGTYRKAFVRSDTVGFRCVVPK